MSTALVIHGHFYQPPRENPWTDTVDREPSAAPWHDWNERIHAECYRANAFARVSDAHGRVERIVNNYALMSFNLGPTLLTWLERHHPATYARVLAADQESAGRHGGHGNAIAQAYNHAILPLCNDRDRRTQIAWGVADFRHRFGRAPESLWLSETACNDETLGALIDAGMAYVILSPHQAERVRPVGTGEWVDVRDGSVDPGVAYRYAHRDGSGRSIAVFFYDGPLARAIAFEGALTSSGGLIDRFQRCRTGEGRILHVATDGESYGHHHKFGDRCLAHALGVEAPARGFWVTNYGEYLERFPPRWEVEIKPGPGGEGTAWSCAHGVGRWYRDCGCNTGAKEGWNQAWRTPLRKALDVLRDDAARLFEGARGELFDDPWAARDAYIELVLDAERSPEEFLHRHAGRRLREREQVRALTLLEMQRHALLMYTSCGWFFADLAGLETIQILRYAGRVLDFLDELGAESPRERFLEALAVAQSNQLDVGDGEDVWRARVEPARVTAPRIAAHLAITSLVGENAGDGEVAGYVYTRSEFRKERLGRLVLATGRWVLESKATGAILDYAAAAMHLGGVDFYGSLRPFPGGGAFRRSRDRLWANQRTGSLPTILRIAQEEFGPEEYGLEHVLPEGRQRVSEIVYGDLERNFLEQYARLYTENRRTIEMLREAGFELPPELRAAAEFTLGRRFEEEIRRQHESRDPAAYRRALEIADEVARGGYHIDRAAARAIFEDMILRATEAAIAAPSRDNLRAALDLVALTRKLRIEADLARAQEALYDAHQREPSGHARLHELTAALGLAPPAPGVGAHLGDAAAAAV